MKSILIVDDDENIRNLLKQFLEENNYNTYEAMNGYEAAALQRKHNPELAIVDISMPKKGGIETVKKLNSLDPSPSIFLITGKTLKGSKSKLLKKIREQVRVDDSFTKPIDLDKLLEKIKVYIGAPDILPEEEEIVGNRSRSFFASKVFWVISIIIAFLLGYFSAVYIGG